MIAEHADGWNSENRQFTDERARFLREPEVGQVAADHQNIGALIDLAQKRLQASWRRVAAVMKIADCRDANDALDGMHRLPHQ